MPRAAILLFNQLNLARIRLVLDAVVLSILASVAHPHNLTVSHPKRKSCESMLSGCATQPAATIVSIVPTSLRFVVMSKVPTPTLSASQVTVSPIATALPANTVSVPTYTPPTVVPTFSASGPTLVPNTVNAQAFNKNAQTLLPPYAHPP